MLPKLWIAASRVATANSSEFEAALKAAGGSGRGAFYNRVKVD